MATPPKTRPPWVGFAIGLLAVALPLSGYFVYRAIVRAPAERAPAVAAEAPRRGSAAPVNPTFRIDESKLEPSGMSLRDPGPPIDPKKVRAAIGKAEGWLRTFTIDPFSGTGSDSLRIFAIEVDCWHRLWFSETDPSRKGQLEEAVRERLRRFLQPEKIGNLLRAQGTLQGVLEILMLAARCREHEIDVGPLMPVIQSISPAIGAEMDRLPPSTAALFAWALSKLEVDLGRPLSSYRDTGLVFLQPREVEMSGGDVSNLTQEILAFTNGGTEPFTYSAPDEKRYLERVLPYFAVSYTLVGRNELVGDLLTGLSCTGQADTFGYRDALRTLITRQNPDGSFSSAPGAKEARGLRLAPTASCLGALCIEKQRAPGSR
jgi:hypothetical protein